MLAKDHSMSKYSYKCSRLKCFEFIEVVITEQINKIKSSGTMARLERVLEFDQQHLICSWCLLRCTQPV